MRDLTAAELGIFLGHQVASDPTIYNCAELIEFNSPLDADTFERALRRTYERFEILRTRFIELEGVPKAALVDSMTSQACWRSAHVRRVSLPARLSIGNGEDTGAAMRPVFESDLRAPFDLTTGFTHRHLLTCRENQLTGWLLVAHHVILDGFAFQLVARAVAAEYTALTTGSTELPAVTTPLAEVAAADASYQNSPDHAADLAFFSRTPFARWPAARLSRFELRAGHGLAGSAARPLRQQTTVSPETLTRLRDYARKVGASWPEVALAVTAHFVSSASGMRRFVLGIPVMLRLGTTKLKLPCMAMNIVRVPFALEPGQALHETLVQLQTRWREQSPHHRLRYEELNDAAFGPVVNVLPFVEPLNFGGSGSTAVGLSAGPVTDLALMMAPRADGLELTVDGHPLLFNCESLSRLASEWVGFLDTLGQGDADAESDQGPDVRALPHGQEPYPDVMATWFEMCRRRGKAVAVVCGSEQLTYGQLRARVERAAFNLRRRIELPGDDYAHQVIALELPRGVDAIVILLATLSVGAAYAFLDPDQPLARRRDLTARLRPALLITHRPELWEEAAVELQTLNPTKLQEVDGTIVPHGGSSPDPSDPAYVVFTSGSTGAPKAVVLSRGALSAFVASATGAYPIGNADRVLQFAPLTFDASVEEIFCTLCVGATLVIRNSEMLESMSAFTETCNRWRITVLDLPTAFWHEWVHSMRGPEACPVALRAVLIGGEAADLRCVESFRRHAQGVTLLNTYGPSEATVVATFADLTGDSDSDGVSMGRPFASVGAHIVDEQGTEILGAGEGELWLSGPQLASRYLGSAAETKRRFVAMGTPPLRVYRTGDRVRRNAKGQHFFLGRIDHEIKLSGYRISPIEIEAVIHSHELVAASAVVAGKHHGHVVLTAHIQPRVHSLPAGNDAQLAETLRRFMTERLPLPMVPTRYFFHASLPLNASGKVDRRALADEDSVAAAEVNDPSFAQNPGRELLGVWRAVLGRPDAGPDDDFFRLGGHSLQVIQLSSRLGSILPGISVSAIFRHPTPRALLAAFTNGGGAADLRYRNVPPLDFGPRLYDRAPNTDVPSVLLTGATGFVGATLVATLLGRGAKVMCLVRAETNDDARSRVTAALLYHRCPLASAQLERLTTLALDLSNPLSASAAVERLGRHDVVLHCAADVNLTRTFESLEPSNVTASRWLLGYAHYVGARFSYISTLAVVPASVDKAPALEAIFDAHAGLVDGYQQSKWHAEQLCQRAASLGLDVQVVRLGRVVGSTEQATVNPNDLVWRIARAATRCGYWPELPFAEVWTAVDTIAAIVSGLALAPRHAEPALMPSVYHVSHQGTVHLDRLHSRLIAAGYALSRCALSAWLDHVRTHADAEDLATLAFFELAADAGKLPAQSTFDDTRLRLALPDLDTRPITDDLIDRYIAAAAAQRHLAPISAA